MYFGSDKELFAAPLLLWLPEAKLRAPDDSSAIPLESLLEPDGLVSIAVETALRYAGSLEEVACPSGLLVTQLAVRLCPLT